MRCPRCQVVELDERERDGIVVDACRECRGIWLDRGELERLLARAQRDGDDERRRYDDDDEPESDRRPYDGARGRPGEPPRKRRWFDALGDIFD